VLLRRGGARAGGAGAAGARRGAVHAVRGVRARGARRGAAGRRPPDPHHLLRREDRPVHRHAVARVSASVNPLFPSPRVTFNSAPAMAPSLCKYIPIHH